MESNFDLDDDEGESMYDLRMIERETFGEMYNELLDNYTEMNARATKREKPRAYFRSIASTMAQYLKHYMTDEELVEVAERTQYGAVGAEGVNEMRADVVLDNIERLRHAAGLKLPQESNPDPESVGAEQL